MELIYWLCIISEYLRISHFPQSWHYVSHINRTWIISLVDPLLFEAGSQCIAPTGPKPLILLFEPLETRDYRCVLPHPESFIYFLSNIVLTFFLSKSNFLIFVKFYDICQVLMAITQMPFTRRSLLIPFSPETPMPSNWVSFLVLIHLLIEWSTSLSNFFQDK